MTVDTSKGADYFGARLVHAGTGPFECVAFFTTHYGSWEVGSAWGMEQRFRDAYLRREFDDAGGDHHIFARVEDANGKPIPCEIEFTTEGGLREIKDTGKKRSGWQNIPVWSAGWTWGPVGCEQVTGGYSHSEHVSAFVVWRPRVTPPPPPPPSEDCESVTAVHVRNGIIQGAWWAGSVDEMIRRLQDAED